MPRKTKTPAKITYPKRSGRKKAAPPWDADKVRALRDYMGLTQVQFAEELGILQQTVSQWECGYHYPKGASVTVLNMVAERAKFNYGEAASKESVN